MNLKDLSDSVTKLQALLRDPHPGLFTWWGFVRTRIGEIAAFDRDTSGLMTVQRIVDCPECHEKCEWCAWYRKNARATGCGSAGKRKCAWGQAAKGVACSLCGGYERVLATTTYSTMPPPSPQADRPMFAGMPVREAP